MLPEREGLRTENELSKSEKSDMGNIASERAASYEAEELLSRAKHATTKQLPG
jgi:hypothetical protein